MDGLLEGSFSFNEVEERSTKLKALSTTKSAFLEGVNIKSWDVAKKMIPTFAKEEVLSKFQLQKGKPLPGSFKVSLQQ